MRASEPAVILAFVVSLVPGAAAAQGLNYWRDLPASHMTDEDRRIATTAIRTALDDGADGTSYRWENRQTGASGAVLPKKSFTRDGMRCRQADFSVSAGGRDNKSTWNVCRTADGWKILD